MSVSDVFARIKSALDSAGIPFMLSGSFASAAYGVPRSTQDIDFVIAATASQLYAKNLYAFLETLIDKDAKSIKIDPEEELVKATLLTRDGAIVNPAFAAS